MARVEPPSGTRDFVGDEDRRRKAAFDTAGTIFEHHRFEPLTTPAFERLEVFAGKLSESVHKGPPLSHKCPLDAYTFGSAWGS
ncbi:hypothetical protein CFP71_12895 [Amycolatopsis thailandensis]|uniref:Uncharacterized protein n=1 Tax=Amycolatopsis thailandensis TaxID=589330 RepID=A0A229SD24_9PSEU|nr:hypothetical protein CFP71_12895 [Amycolatopsis thailandensis]